jgi:cytochrome P450
VTTTLPPSFPFAGPQAEPAPEFRRFRDAERLTRVRLPDGNLAWLVTRHSDVRRVLTDPRFSRAAMGSAFSAGHGPAPTTMLGMDPPEHTRVRELATAAFTGHRIERLRPLVQALAEELLDEMTHIGPPADLVAEFAQPLTGMVLCDLLGVDRADWLKLRDWSDAVFSSLDRGEQDGAALSELTAYFTELATAKRRDDGDGVLDVLRAAGQGEDRLTTDELVSVGMTLLVAQAGGTAGQIANGMLVLLHHPEQLASLGTDPESIRRAVEELLRHVQTSNIGQIQVAVADVELRGTLIRAGEPVITPNSAANRDPAVFPDPDRLDLSRKDNPHLSFGHGIHHCLGANLARLQLQVAFGSLLRRFPRPFLAVGESALRWKASVIVCSLAELPVTW